MLRPVRMASERASERAVSRNLAIYLVAQGLSFIGSFSQTVVLSLLVLDLSGSGLALGGTMGLQAIPHLLFSPVAGPLIDRLPRRRLLMATALAGALQAASLAALDFSGQISLPVLYALAFVGGCIQVFDRPAIQAFLGELVPHAQIHRAVSLSSSAQAFGRLGGPALAAVLYAWHGAGPVFAANALSFLLVIAALLALRREAMFPSERHGGRSSHLWPALQHARRSPVLGPVLLANFIVGLFAFNFPTFYATMATLTFGRPELFGAAESLNALFAVLTGALLARYLHVPTLRHVGLASMALGATLTGVALAPTPALFLGTMPFFGAAVVTYTATAQAVTQRWSPRAMTGRMLSLFTLGSIGTTPLGGLIVGYVIDHASPRAAVGLGAASALLVGLLLVLRGTAGEQRIGLAGAPAQPEHEA